MGMRDFLSKEIRDIKLRMFMQIGKKEEYFWYFFFSIAIVFKSSIFPLDRKKFEKILLCFKKVVGKDVIKLMEIYRCFIPSNFSEKKKKKEKRILIVKIELNKIYISNLFVCINFLRVNIRERYH